MTVKLKDYGIHGPWLMTECDGCGNRRSCLVSQVAEDESLAICVMCLVKDIQTMEAERIHFGEGDLEAWEQEQIDQMRLDEAEAYEDQQQWLRENVSKCPWPIHLGDDCAH